MQARRGGLKDCTGDELLSTVFKATIQQTGVEPAVRQLLILPQLTGLWPWLAASQHNICELYPLAYAQAIGDVVIGSVLPLSGQRANECRIAMFLAGFPDTVPVRTVNRSVQLHTLPVAMQDT